MPRPHHQRLQADAQGVTVLPRPRSGVYFASFNRRRGPAPLSHKPLCMVKMVCLVSHFQTVALLATVVLAGLIACNDPGSASRQYHPDCAPYQPLAPDTSWWKFEGGKPVFSFLLPPSFKQINKDAIGIDTYPATFRDSTTTDSTEFRIGFDYGRWGGIGGERDHHACRSVDTTTVADREAVVARFKSKGEHHFWYQIEVVFLRDRPFPLNLWHSAVGWGNEERLTMSATCPRRTDCAAARGVFESLEFTWWY
jgi:hypothetical protein